MLNKCVQSFLSLCERVKVKELNGLNIFVVSRFLCSFIACHENQSVLKLIK